MLTANLANVGVTSMLEAIRLVDAAVRFYQASSSETFGQPYESSQNEETALRPLTPYRVAKAYGHQITRAYRWRYGPTRAPGWPMTIACSLTPTSPASSAERASRFRRR